MMRFFTIVKIVVLFSCLFLTATVESQSPAGSAPREIQTEVQKAEPRIDQVIERANDRFRRGMLDLEDNKRAKARDEFDKAIDEILMSGLDVRASQRLQQFYYELVERIYREETKGSPPPPRSERIRNPIKSDDLYIPPVDPVSKPIVSPQDKPSDDANTIKYRARKGDTIAKIAASQGLSAEQVSRLNGIAVNAELQPGQEIKLPIIPTELGSLRSEYVKSTQEYKASLERLLALYLESEKRAADRLIQAKKLYDDKLLFQPDVDRAQKAFDEAKLKVEDARKQIAEADHKIAQALIEAREQQIKQARDRERADEIDRP